jgi:hypothetical protein
MNAVQLVDATTRRLVSDAGSEGEGSEGAVSAGLLQPNANIVKTNRIRTAKRALFDFIV